MTNSICDHYTTNMLVNHMTNSSFDQNMTNPFLEQAYDQRYGQNCNIYQFNSMQWIEHQMPMIYVTCYLFISWLLQPLSIDSLDTSPFLPPSTLLFPLRSSYPLSPFIAPVPPSINSMGLTN